MRFELNQTLFGVHFGTGNVGIFDRLFRMPYLHNADTIKEINFIQLEVAEHHKVPYDHDPKQERKFDDYLLKDKSGKTFANQYPSASYGQTSDEGNRRFERYEVDTMLMGTLLADDVKEVLEYHLLSDVLERMEEGIKELSLINSKNTCYPVVQTKMKLLQDLYDKTVEQFHQQFPDYQLKMEWKQPFKNSTLLWPDVTITKV